MEEFLLTYKEKLQVDYPTGALSWNVVTFRTDLRMFLFTFIFVKVSCQSGKPWSDTLRTKDLSNPQGLNLFKALCTVTHKMWNFYKSYFRLMGLFERSLKVKWFFLGGVAPEAKHKQHLYIAEWILQGTLPTVICPVYPFLYASRLETCQSGRALGIH